MASDIIFISSILVSTPEQTFSRIQIEYQYLDGLLVYEVIL